MKMMTWRMMWKMEEVEVVECQSEMGRGRRGGRGSQSEDAA